jgi:hypothetical protein
MGNNPSNGDDKSERYKILVEAKEKEERKGTRKNELED